jgi:putative hydrolase of the HAD superfamily
MTTKELINEFKIKLNEQISEEEILERIEKSYTKHSVIVNTELLDYIKQIKQTHKVFLLTDTIDLHDVYNKTRNIYPQFDFVFKSYVEHFKKPDRKAFENLLNKTSSKPAECVFIDDTVENVEAAKKLGMQGLIYASFEDLKNQLIKIL